MLKLNFENKSKLFYQAYFENLKHDYSNLVSHVLSKNIEIMKNKCQVQVPVSHSMVFLASPRARIIYSCGCGGYAAKVCRSRFLRHFDSSFHKFGSDM